MCTLISWIKKGVTRFILSEIAKSQGTFFTEFRNLFTSLLSETSLLLCGSDFVEFIIVVFDIFSASNHDNRLVDAVPVLVQ